MAKPSQAPEQVDRTEPKNKYNKTDKKLARGKKIICKNNRFGCPCNFKEGKRHRYETNDALGSCVDGMLIGASKSGA